MSSDADLKKAYAELIAKSWSDASFKQKLDQNPQEALKEIGYQIPAGKNPKVVHLNKDDFLVPIPGKPKEDFSEEELKRRVGGNFFGNASQHGYGSCDLSCC